MVEAALALPILVLLLLSTVDVCMIVGIQLALQNAVAVASRYAATGQTVSGSTREESVLRELRNAAPSLTINDADVSFNNLSHVATAGAGGPTDVVTLSVTHQWSLWSPALRLAFGTSAATIRAASTVANEPFPAGGA